MLKTLKYIFHCCFGPAVSKNYYDDLGQYHREDGPAYYHENYICWYKHGILHRLDGPAVIYVDGRKAWWVDGERHRLDGPAVIRQDGYEAWHQNGELHRLDGPAVIRTDGGLEWWVNGNWITEIVYEWMADMSINTNWREWTDTEMILFRLMF